MLACYALTLHFVLAIATIFQRALLSPENCSFALKHTHKTHAFTSPLLFALASLFLLLLAPSDMLPWTGNCERKENEMEEEKEQEDRNERRQ